MTKNKTRWVTGLACTGSAMSPSVVVVAPLKPKRTCPAEFNIREESFIWLNAGRCNKSAKLPGFTNALCTSKPLIQRVCTSASLWSQMTLFRFTRGNNIGPSISLVSSRLPPA